MIQERIGKSAVGRKPISLHHIGILLCQKSVERRTVQQLSQYISAYGKGIHTINNYSVIKHILESFTFLSHGKKEQTVLGPSIEFRL